MVDMALVRLPIRVASSQLGETELGFIVKWTGFILLQPPKKGRKIYKGLFFNTRYDSEGSPDKRNKIPDINKARYLHACAAFISATGKEVDDTNIFFIFMLY